MNRRSFIAGILTALVAPAILVPKCADRARWKYRRRNGLYIAEFVCAVAPYPEQLTDVMFLERLPDEKFEVNPEWISARYDLPPVEVREYSGRWKFVEWHGPPSFVKGQTL